MTTATWNGGDRRFATRRLRGVAAFTLHSRAAFDMSTDSFETQVSDARYRFHNPNLKQILEGPRSLRDVIDGQ